MTQQAQQFEFYEVTSLQGDTNVYRDGYRYQYDKEAKLSGNFLET